MNGQGSPCPPRALQGRQSRSFTATHGQSKPLLDGCVLPMSRSSQALIKQNFSGGPLLRDGFRQRGADGGGSPGARGYPVASPARRVADCGPARSSRAVLHLAHWPPASFEASSPTRRDTHHPTAVLQQANIPHSVAVSAWRVPACRFSRSPAVNHG